MLNDHCFAVVMAGGAGTRLWPLSSRNRPKHLLKLFDGKSLIELTIDKLRDHIPDERIIVLTSIHYKALTRETLPRIPSGNFIFEPCVRDTASAIALAATVLKKRCPSATMVMLTADQIIEPADRFNAAIAHAADFLEANPEKLIAFGVEAASANTKVGWQKLGEPLDFPGCPVRQIAAFTEKPDLPTAQKYMDEGGYAWNSGQFAWKAETILNEITAQLPEAAPLLAQIGEAWHTDACDQVLNELFPRMPKGSIDYEVMQKTRNACCIFLPCSWEDMGTYASVAGKVCEERDGNRIAGKAIVRGTGNSVLNVTDKTVVVDCDNKIVAVTDDAVFIGAPDGDMKSLVKRITREAPEIL